MAILDHSNNIILVKLPPEPQIRNELDKAMEIVRQGGGCDVIIDFSRVDIMTSLSISGFLQLYKILAKFNRGIVFFNVTPLVKDIFNATCLDNIFKFADDIHIATSFLQIADKPN